MWIIWLLNLLSSRSILRRTLIKLPIHFSYTCDKIEYKSKGVIDNKKVEHNNISFTNTFSKYRTMMIILLTAPITKCTMFCTDITINLTSHTVDSFLWKRFLFIIKYCPWVKKEQTSIKKRYWEHQWYDNGSESFAYLSVVKQRYWH